MEQIQNKHAVNSFRTSGGIMKRIVVLSDNIDHKWLTQIQALFPECQIEIQSRHTINGSPFQERVHKSE
jgi:hypothetical protein